MNKNIGEVARMTGVSTETIRRWERQGLIPKGKRIFIARWRVWRDEEVALIKLFVKDRRKARNRKTN